MTGTATVPQTGQRGRSARLVMEAEDFRHSHDCFRIDRLSGAKQETLCRPGNVKTQADR